MTTKKTFLTLLKDTILWNRIIYKELKLFRVILRQSETTLQAMESFESSLYSQGYPEHLTEEILAIIQERYEDALIEEENKQAKDN
jgi:hypothetical protein